MRILCLIAFGLRERRPTVADRVGRALVPKIIARMLRPCDSSRILTRHDGIRQQGSPKAILYGHLRAKVLVTRSRKLRVGVTSRRGGSERTPLHLNVETPAASVMSRLWIFGEQYYSLTTSAAVVEKEHDFACSFRRSQMFVIRHKSDDLIELLPQCESYVSPAHN